MIVLSQKAPSVHLRGEVFDEGIAFLPLSEVAYHPAGERNSGYHHIQVLVHLRQGSHRMKLPDEVALSLAEGVHVENFIKSSVGGPPRG